MTDILDLPGWTVLGQRIDGNECEIEAECTAHLDARQKCGVVGRLYRHGAKDTTYLGSPI